MRRVPSPSPDQLSFVYFGGGWAIPGGAFLLMLGAMLCWAAADGIDGSPVRIGRLGAQVSGVAATVLCAGGMLMGAVFAVAGFYHVFRRCGFTLDRAAKKLVRWDLWIFAPGGVRRASTGTWADEVCGHHSVTDISGFDRLELREQHVASRRNPRDDLYLCKPGEEQLLGSYEDCRHAGHISEFLRLPLRDLRADTTR